MPDLARRDDRRRRREVQQQSAHKTQGEAEQAAKQHASAGKDTSIPPLSDEARQKAMAFAERDLKENKEVYEALASE